MPPKWLVVARIGAKLDFGGPKILNILKYSRRQFPRKVAAKWHKLITKWPCSGANGANRVNFGIMWRKLGASWRTPIHTYLITIGTNWRRPSGLRAGQKFGATASHYAPNINLWREQECSDAGPVDS